MNDWQEAQDYLDRAERAEREISEANEWNRKANEYFMFENIYSRNIYSRKRKRFRCGAVRCLEAAEMYFDLSVWHMSKTK